ncbi:MAG: AraC family transcriptional regulator [Lachnospiraceae bacterium]|nr:AraC family transcriptional regulator [Lachnospiraceae bacterium]
MPQDLVGCDFCKFVNYEDSDDFYLYELGTNKCEPLYSYTHHVKNRIILHFVVRGRGILRLNGKQYDVGPHQAFLIPADTRTFYQADKDDPWEYIWFHIGGPKIPLILKEAGLTPSHPVFTPIACADKIEDLARDILDNYTRQYYCIGTLYKICDYMIRYAASSQDSAYENSLLYVKNVISYIQLKYSEHVKIENIAVALGLNRSYLTRLFKEATGYSLQEYLITYRMKMAIKLLSENELSVSEIAEAVGYTDTFTFSKAFKRHFGQSPSACRGIDYSIANGMLGQARASKTTGRK